MANVTSYMCYDNTNLTNYKQWAQAIGAAFNTLGWVKDTNDPDGYQVVWANAAAVPTGSPYQNSLNSGAHGQQAWISGTSYTGTAASSGGNFDIVTDAGVTYCCISSTSGTTHPASDPSHWQPYNYEIWTTNGPTSATFKLYVKIVYSNNGSSQPTLYCSIGTSSDGKGKISGNMFNQGLETQLQGSIGNTGSTLYISDFSGDADNIRFCLWRTYGNTVPTVFFVDRVNDQFGTNGDFAAIVGYSNAGSTSNYQHLYKNGANIPANGTNSYGNGFPFVRIPVPTMAFQGQIPAFPLFPPYGFLGCPHVGMVAFAYNDVQDGDLVNVYILGSSRTYRVIKVNCTSYMTTSTASQGALGILWS